MARELGTGNTSQMIELSSETACVPYVSLRDKTRYRNATCVGHTLLRAGFVNSKTPDLHLMGKNTSNTRRFFGGLLIHTCKATHDPQIVSFPTAHDITVSNAKNRSGQRWPNVQGSGKNQNPGSGFYFWRVFFISWALDDNIESLFMSETKQRGLPRNRIRNFEHPHFCYMYSITRAVLDWNPLAERNLEV